MFDTNDHIIYQELQNIIPHNLTLPMSNNNNVGSNSQDAGYARLPQYAPSPYNNPQPVQHQPVVVHDPMNYGQPVYGQPYNQGFMPNPVPNQGFDNNAALMNYAKSVRCLALTVIVENLVYIIFDIAYYGFTLNYLFLLMIVEVCVFIYYLTRVSHNTCQPQHYLAAKKFYLVTFICYSIYFTLITIILASISTEDYDVDKATIIWVFVISTLIFLLPRFIAFFIVKNWEKRFGGLGARPVIYVNQ